MFPPRPAAARPSLDPAPARRATRRRGLASGIVVAAVLAWFPGACGDPPPTSTPAPAMAGLVILAGEPGAATLTVHDDAAVPRGVQLPAAGTGWISAGRGGRLAATLDDGTVRVSDALADDRNPAWRPATDDGTELPAEPLRFATWSPTGTHIAALAADPGAAAGLTVTVIDPVARAALLLPVRGRAAVAPLAWLSDERLLVQADGGSLVVDILTGEIGQGPQLEPRSGAPIATVPRSLVAVADPGGGAVEVRQIDGWLAGDRGEPLARIEADAEAGAIALTPSGDRLAVVWQQVEEPGAVVVYRRADGWTEAGRSTLPGESARAAVDWLR